jgi:hypothetical protein
MPVSVTTFHRVNFEIAQDGPGPIAFWIEDAAGLPAARDPSLECVITSGDGSFTLAVGSGITLGPRDGVADAHVEVKIDPAAIAGFPAGPHTQIRFREGAGAARRTIIIGTLNLK